MDHSVSQTKRPETQLPRVISHLFLMVFVLGRQDFITSGHEPRLTGEVPLQTESL